MISLEDVEAAVHYLADSAQDFAKAVGRRSYLEEKRKVIKSKGYRLSGGKSVADREAEAYTTLEYTELLDELREAVEMEVLYRSLRAAHESTIDVWRTQEASARKNFI